MSGEVHTTTDHELIREWTENRGGRPAEVASTGSGDDPGILRIDFPGQSGDDDLQEISWDDFFEKFEEKKLAFVFQETVKSGEVSRFSKLVSRESK